MAVYVDPLADFEGYTGPKVTTDLGLVHSTGKVSLLFVPDSGAVQCDHGKGLLRHCTECDRAYFAHVIGPWVRAALWAAVTVLCLAFWAAVIITLWAVL